MTKIIDMGRYYTIVKTSESSGYPENQISVFGHGDSGIYNYDIYGTVKDNAVFEFNTQTFTKDPGAKDCYVTNHTNKTIHVVCRDVESGDSEATLGPNETQWFNTYGYYSPFKITITVLDVKTKPAEQVRGFVY